MKIFLSLAIVAFYFQSSLARIGSVRGFCREAAQSAADALAKINHLEKAVIMDLQGEPDGFEMYKDEDGYFTILTQAGRGEDQCRVSRVFFNPEP